jgi:hypothetical protein
MLTLRIVDFIVLVIVAILALNILEAFFIVKEKFLGVDVENAFTNTRCVDDDLPLVRFYPDDTPNTFRCLTTDGTNCITRTALSVPQEYQCDNSQKNVNYFLTTDGLRNVRVNPSLPISRVFNDFENLRLLNTTDPSFNNNIKFLTCTPDGLKNPNHWCGKVWNKISSQCNTPRGKFGEYSGVCKTIPTYMNTANAGTPVQVMSAIQIAAAQKKAIANMDSARANNIRGKR